MVKLSFSGFAVYRKKLDKYLEDKKCKDDFKMYQLDAIKKLVDTLNMTNECDVEHLAFLMWKFLDKFIILLNSDYLMTKIDLGFFKSVLLKNLPKIGRVADTENSESEYSLPNNDFTIGYYDCLKFIAQYTNSQKVYDECLDIFESILGLGICGRIMEPHIIMYLMNYNPNQNIDKSKNKFKVKPINQHVDKFNDFNHSVWDITFNDNHHNSKYKRDIQKAYLLLMATTTNANEYEIMCTALVNEMINSHFCVISNTDIIETFHSKVQNIPFKNIEKILIDIDNIVIEEIEVSIEEKNKQDLAQRKAIIESKLKILDEYDYEEITSIGLQAFIYVADELYEKEALKRDMLIELYYKKLAMPNSKFSHNLIRCAVGNGRLWLVKFLIEQGVPTKNLPTYGSYKWDLESKQLDVILNEKITECSNSRENWLLTKAANYKIVQSYMIENGYI